MTRPLSQKISGQIEVVRRNAWTVAKETGKSVRSQLVEIVALRLGVGRLLPREYYEYQLYDDRQYSWSEKKRFLGSDLETGLIPFLGERDWIGLANDKLASYAFFKGLGFPIPETFAVCHAFRRFGDVPTLRTREELAHYLRTEPQRPFIVKPIFGIWGRDVWGVDGYDAQGDRLVLINGSEIGVDAFIDGFAHRLRPGVLLQELLRPHADIADMCGTRICSVRMVSLIDRAGPRLISTLWKITAGDNMARATS
jgi:hypothetical protein